MATQSRRESILALETANRNSVREARMDGFLPQIATKEDMQKLRADLTWRIIIAMRFLTAIFVVIRLTLSGG